MHCVGFMLPPTSRFTLDTVCPLWKLPCCLSQLNPRVDRVKVINNAVMTRCCWFRLACGYKSIRTHSLYTPLVLTLTYHKQRKCAGARESVRFLPALNVKEGEVAQALDILDNAMADVFNN